MDLKKQAQKTNRDNSTHSRTFQQYNHPLQHHPAGQTGGMIQFQANAASGKRSLNLINSPDEEDVRNSKGDPEIEEEEEDEGYDKTSASASPRTTTETPTSVKKARMNESTSTKSPPTHNVREIKNAREKERSSRIAKQIDELRDILKICGHIVPKGTKSSVLTEVASYIRTLQQQQVRYEVDRNMLVQQIQTIGRGAHGPDAAAAIRYAAAQNGVGWSVADLETTTAAAVSSTTTGIRNLNSASSSASSSSLASATAPVAEATPSAVLSQQLHTIDAADYQCIFNNTGVGMAIASMGGAFMDCNHLFSKLSDYSKAELCTLTLFNLTSRNDLQRSFDLISRMITPSTTHAPSQPPPKQVVLRGCMRSRNDLGMSISLVKGEDGIAKCFCVTLVKNPASPFETNTHPALVSFESIIPYTSPSLSSLLVNHQLQHINTSNHSKDAEVAANSMIHQNITFTSG